MIDHISLCVGNFEESKSFFKKVLAPLGYRSVAGFEDGFAGFETSDKPDFWISKGEATKPRIHVAFRCKSRAEVDAFYNAAIAAGATDNGKPGLRPHYHPNYYGAFVLGPDGHNIEAVCHSPE